LDKQKLMQNFEHDSDTEGTFSSTRQRSCLIAALTFFCVMIAVGALPGSANALSAVIYDKLLHFSAYALLSTLVYAGLPGTPAARSLRTLAIIFVLGSIDEMIQLLLPYRNPNWLDWKFDMLAAMTCVGMLMLIHPVVTARKALRIAPINQHPAWKP
jgi:VanZ family protein